MCVYRNNRMYMHACRYTHIKKEQNKECTELRESRRRSILYLMAHSNSLIHKYARKHKHKDARKYISIHNTIDNKQLEDRLLA